MNLEKTLHEYLKNQGVLEKPFALALSGGPDSMALFFVMLKVKKPSLVLHVNHKMREESDQEERIIKQLCLENDVQLETTSLEGFDFEKGNIEDRLREKRYQFFQNTLKNCDINNLFLGHQAEDAEENIFKRVLEGASFFNIGNILINSSNNSIQLHRPFIRVHKVELIDFLESNKLPFFIDYTNFDRKYLRSRMRLDIFPNLEEKFGKSIKGKFIKLGNDTNRIKEYLSLVVRPYANKLEKTKIGYFLPNFHLHPVEEEALFHEVAKYLDITINKSQLDQILKLYGKQSNKLLIIESNSFHFEKMGLFIENKKNWGLKIESTFLKDEKFDIIKLLAGEKIICKKGDLPFFIRSKISNEFSLKDQFLVQLD